MRAFIDKSLIQVLERETGWNEESIKLKIIDHILDVRSKLEAKGNDPNKRGCWTRSMKGSRFFIRIKNNNEVNQAEYQVAEAKIQFIEVSDVVSFKEEILTSTFEESFLKP